MYPLFCKQPYPRQQWYMAAWREELTDKPLGRTILGTPIVLYRDQEGKAAALDGRCPHRRFPLAKGWVENGSIVCAYHGFAFDKAGHCVNVPSQSKPLESQKTIAFPVHESWNWIWVWMGDPNLVDYALLPSLDLVHAHEQDWHFVMGGITTLRARYMLLHDNLLDLSHLSYLHKNTVGSPGIAAAKVASREVSWGLDIMREVRGDHMGESPLGKALEIKGPIDRLMPQQYAAPCLHITGPEFRSAEDGGVDPGRLFGSFRVIHGIVPETEHSTHYFWGFTRNFKQDDLKLSSAIRGNIMAAVKEDIEASEDIESMLSVSGGPDEISSPADIIAAKGRRIMKRLIEMELKN